MARGFDRGVRDLQQDVGVAWARTAPAGEVLTAKLRACFGGEGRRLVRDLAGAVADAARLLRVTIADVPPAPAALGALHLVGQLASEEEHGPLAVDLVTELRIAQALQKVTSAASACGSRRR